MALRIPDDNINANFDWVQSGPSFGLQLSGPLGQGMVRLDGGPDEVVLTGAEGEVTRAATAEALLSRRLGWQLPVSGLVHWLLGRPDPRGLWSELTLGESGVAKTFEQFGWAVRYSRYIEVDGVRLPTRLALERGDVKAKILVSRWETGL